MKLSYIKYKNKTKINPEIIEKSIMNFVKKSKFPKQLLISKIELLTDKHKKLINDYEIKIEEGNKYYNENISSLNKIRYENSKVIERLKKSI